MVSKGFTIFLNEKTYCSFAKEKSIVVRYTLTWKPMIAGEETTIYNRTS